MTPADPSGNVARGAIKPLTCLGCGAVGAEQCDRRCPERRKSEAFEAEVRQLASDLERRGGVPWVEAMSMARRALRESLVRAAARATVRRLLGQEPEAVVALEAEPIPLTLAGGDR